MTISLEEAKHLVGWSDDHEIVWQVREFQLGWCFWVESRRFRETGDIEDVLFGEGEHFVTADTAQVVRAGSGVRYRNAEADLLEMARMGLPLDQQHFETFTSNQLRQDPSFLSQEELKRILSEPDP
jgi:hypothetical protein